MKKVIISIIVLLVVILPVLLFFASKQSKKTTEVTPTSGPTPTRTNERPIPTTKIAVKCSAISVLSPRDNSKVITPLTVRVVVDNRGECHWTVFEAQAGTVTITDGLGKVVGQGVLKTAQEWTTPNPVTYTATITLSKPTTSGGTLTITEENPSGKENPQKHSVPVSF